MPKRRAEYRLSPAATRDLEAIWLYTLERWGLEQANRYTDELVATFNELADNPQLSTPIIRAVLGKALVANSRAPPEPA